MQFNSKMRGRLVIPTGLDQEAIRNIILTDEKIAPMLEGREIKKLIVIPNRLINVII